MNSLIRKIRFLYSLQSNRSFSVDYPPTRSHKWEIGQPFICVEWQLNQHNCLLVNTPVRVKSALTITTWFCFRPTGAAVPCVPHVFKPPVDGTNKVPQETHVNFRFFCFYSYVTAVCSSERQQQIAWWPRHTWLPFATQDSSSYSKLCQDNHQKYLLQTNCYKNSP